MTEEQFTPVFMAGVSTLGVVMFVTGVLIPGPAPLITFLLLGGVATIFSAFYAIFSLLEPRSRLYDYDPAPDDPDDGERAPEPIHCTDGFGNVTRLRRAA